MWNRLPFMKTEGLDRLINLPGWILVGLSFTGNVLFCDLRLDGRLKLICPKCGKRMSLNRHTHHEIKDLAMGVSMRSELRYDAPQGRCRSCNTYHTFHPPGVEADSKTTSRYRQFVSLLCRKMTLVDVAKIMGFAPSTAYKIDFRHLLETVPEPSLDNLEALLIDENSVRCGEMYVTFVLNARTGELLFQGSGRRCETLTEFFNKLTKEQKDSIKAVCIDRSGAFKKAIEKELPQADIVYDKFHLIANYHEVIDKVRRKAWHDANENDRKFIKGQRYNLFRNIENLDSDMKVELDRLLKANQSINIAYQLRDQFKAIWKQLTPESITKAIEHWIGLAKESGIEPVIRFAKNLKRSKKQIAAYAKHKITNGLMEGFNNKVSRLIHRANGIRSLVYLFLRLRAEPTPRRVCGAE
jgi:transposase